MTMTTTNLTDFNYDVLKYTVGIDSAYFKYLHKSNFEKEALKNSLFELIHDDKPVKIYFDCDYKFPTDGLEMGETLDVIGSGMMDLNIKYINEIFAPLTDVIPDIRYAESHYDHRMIGDIDYWGISFHVVIQNMMAYKKTIHEFVICLNDLVEKDQRLAISHIRDENELYRNFLGFDHEATDLQVYSVGRKMRCIHASKPKENRPFRLNTAHSRWLLPYLSNPTPLSSPQSQNK
jgi:hypothetical protein